MLQAIMQGAGIAAQLGAMYIRGVAAKKARKEASSRDKKMRSMAIGEVRRQQEQFTEDWRRRTEQEKQVMAARGMGRSSQYESQMEYLQETGQRRQDSFVTNIRRINVEYRYARDLRRIENKLVYAGVLEGISAVLTGASGGLGQSTGSTNPSPTPSYGATDYGENSNLYNQNYYQTSGNISYA